MGKQSRRSPSRRRGRSAQAQGRRRNRNPCRGLASGDTAKADQAEATIAGGGSISVQVLNELANVGRRKMQMSWKEIHVFLNMLRDLLTVHPVTVETHETGLGLAERYGLSTYDAMIAASAINAGCDTLWSEDMQHDMMLDKALRVLNPFRTSS
jgi:predicted nucleic acid-binding protein